ncbi:hypothetical protein BH23VER1_BH23VER1_27490 [soil metagenome]
MKKKSPPPKKNPLAKKKKTKTPAATSTATSYQIKVTLHHVRPPVWRRLIVPPDITLGLLHSVILDAMGWSGGHLHDFADGMACYGPADDDPFGFGDDDDVIDESTVKLSSILRNPKDWFDHRYDFGDGWEHRIVLEKVVPATPIQPILCTAGKRACPPEDCGGPWGYQNFLEALADPKHDEHEEMSEWIGGDFDPEHFDLERTNQLLSSNRPK